VPRCRASISNARANKVIVELWTARPGIVIGKKGAEVDVLRAQLEKLAGRPVTVNIVEIKRPELDATLVAQSVAEQLVARVAFRRAMKKAVTSAMEGRGPGMPHPVFRASRRGEMGDANGIARDVCRCTPFARRSTMVRPTLSPRSVSSVSRSGYTVATCFRDNRILRCESRPSVHARSARADVVAKVKGETRDAAAEARQAS